MTSDTPRASETDVPIHTLVTLTAIGAEGLASVSPEDQLSFLYRRGEKFFLSEPSSAFPDGAVYWDAVSVQTCRLQENKKKYLQLFVQQVPVGPDGLPTDFGTTVAAGYIDLSQYAQARGEAHDVKIMLKPSGVMNVNIQVDDVVEGDGAHSPDVSSNSQCVTPDFQSEPSAVSEEEDLGVSSGTNKELSKDHATSNPKKEVESRAGDGARLPCVSDTVSTTSTLSYGDGLEEHSSHHSLESKLRRAQRQCEEARARAFSEASVALQRGIEIDNLKRAKDVLLKRLETAEQQLMTMMKQELAMTIHETDKSSATLLGLDSVIQQLASTKVALAEKEFEVMEMSGKLKARDAHIQALLMHLDAVKESSLMTARSTSAEVGLIKQETSGTGDAKEVGGAQSTPENAQENAPESAPESASDDHTDEGCRECDGEEIVETRSMPDDHHGQPVHQKGDAPLSTTVRIHASTV